MAIIKKIFITFVNLIIIVIFTSLAVNTTEHPQPTDEITITSENIQSIYPYPALVVQKKKKSNHRYSIPQNAFTSSKKPHPYTAFGDRKYLCPVKNEQYNNFDNGYDSQNFNLLDYCLAVKLVKKSSEPVLCESEVKPLIVEFPTKEKCSTNEDDRRYAFVYQNCHNSNSRNNEIGNVLGKFIKQGNPFARTPTNLVVYEFCYNTNKKETLYTYHEIESPLLLTNENLYLEQSIIFPMKTEGYGLFDDEFKKQEEVYKDNKYSMVPQLLVPPDDMVMGLLRKPTYHYVNAKPLNMKLVPIWESINKRVEKLAATGKYSLQIYTRTLGELKNNGKQLFLDDDRTTIPEIWLKLVFHQRLEFDNSDDIYYMEGKGVVFVLHNFINQSQPIGDRYCKYTMCSPKSWKEFINDEMRTLARKYAYCCQVEKEILHDLFSISKDDIFREIEILPYITTSDYMQR